MCSHIIQRKIRTYFKEKSELLVANPREPFFYTVANPARGLLNREKRTKYVRDRKTRSECYTCIAINIHRREPGRDGKILSTHRQDGNVAVCMYVCMYVWPSHIAEYGSTG